MTFTTGKLVTAILLSSIISVASTVTVINYAPNLVAMPIRQPDIQLFSISLASEVSCEPNSDWSTIEEFTKTINVRQDSTLVILFSAKVTTQYTVNDQISPSVVYLNALVDGELANPSEVLISFYEETTNKGTTVVYHYSSVSTGTHTVSFEWKNRGNNYGALKESVIEIFAIPVANTG